jgi:hypothetical protein
VNRSLERTASGENMTFSWTDPFTTPPQKGIFAVDASPVHRQHRRKCWKMSATRNQFFFPGGASNIRFPAVRAARTTKLLPRLLLLTLPAMM